MNKNSKKLLIFSMLMTLFLSLTGCSLFSKNNSGSNNAPKNTNNTPQNTKKDVQKEAPPVQDTKKTEQLKKEKQISNGQVYVQNNIVVATMLIKDDVSESDAKALAEKYAKQLKEEHKDMKVNVQAVQKGKNIANITIEK